MCRVILPLRYLLLLIQNLTAEQNNSRLNELTQRIFIAGILMNTNKGVKQHTRPYLRVTPRTIRSIIRVNQDTIRQAARGTACKYWAKFNKEERRREISISEAGEGVIVSFSGSSSYVIGIGTPRLVYCDPSADSAALWRCKKLTALWDRSALPPRNTFRRIRPTFRFKRSLYGVYDGTYSQ